MFSRHFLRDSANSAEALENTGRTRTFGFEGAVNPKVLDLSSCAARLRQAAADFSGGKRIDSEQILFQGCAVPSRPLILSPPRGTRGSNSSWCDVPRWLCSRTL